MDETPCNDPNHAIRFVQLKHELARKPLDLNKYQAWARQTASYPNQGSSVHYPALKLCGEAGEFAEKVGKLWRNQGKEFAVEYLPVERYELALELGDVLWYVANAAQELGFTLAGIAQMNLDKLADRAKRGVICSEGDAR